jgi:hypothetical protein
VTSQSCEMITHLPVRSNVGSSFDVLRVATRSSPTTLPCRHPMLLTFWASKPSLCIEGQSSCLRLPETTSSTSTCSSTFDKSIPVDLAISSMDFVAADDVVSFRMRRKRLEITSILSIGDLKSSSSERPFSSRDARTVLPIGELLSRFHATATCHTSASLVRLEDWGRNSPRSQEYTVGRSTPSTSASSFICRDNVLRISATTSEMLVLTRSALPATSGDCVVTA